MCERAKLRGSPKVLITKVEGKRQAKGDKVSLHQTLKNWPDITSQGKVRSLEMTKGNG